MQNLAKEVKNTLMLSYVSATATRYSSGIDMTGFKSLQVLVAFATIAAAAAASIKLQQSDDDGVADAYSDIEGSSQALTTADSNTVRYIDCVKPTKRYVRLYITKDGANACAELAIFQQYDPAESPVTQDTSVTGETLIEPAEGTA